MKQSRLVRAMRFIDQICGYMPNWMDEDRIEHGVQSFNLSRSRKVIYAQGMTRHCLITSDYVVKWDKMDEDSKYWIRNFGGVRTEIAFYKVACNDGYGYLFAEAESFSAYGIVFEVMPRVTCLGMDRGKELADVLSEDEYDYVESHVNDVHDENFGFFHGEPLIIDYAGAYIT